MASERSHGIPDTTALCLHPALHQLHTHSTGGHVGTDCLQPRQVEAVGWVRKSQNGLGWKGPLRPSSFTPPCCRQGHLLPDQVAQRPIQPGHKIQCLQNHLLDNTKLLACSLLFEIYNVPAKCLLLTKINGMASFPAKLQTKRMLSP